MKKLFIIFAILCLAAPAMAADWDFYGSARMWTGRTDVDKEANGGVYDDDDTEWQDLGNSRFGGRVDVNDQISGGFELGFQSSGLTDNVYQRKVFGIYNWGGGKLLIGQDYTPLSIFYSGRGSNGDEGLNGFAGAYDGRQAQIKLMMGGLNIALVNPKNVGSGVNDQSTVVVTGNQLAVTGVTYDDTDTTLPKIVVGYKFKTDMMEINPYAGYQTWDGVFQVAGTETDESIDSYVLGVGGKFNFGAAYVNVSAYWAQNPDAFGLTQEAYGAAHYDVVNGTGTYEDNTSYAAMVVAGFKLSDMFTVEAGYGMSTGETDLVGGGGSLKNTASVYYVNFPITIAPGFFIVPEIAIEDYGDYELPTGDLDQGDKTWYGVRWQIDF